MDKDIKGMLIKAGVAVVCITISGYIFNYLYQQISYKKIIKIKQAQLKKKKNDLYNKLEGLKKPFDSMEDITNLSLADLLIGLKAGLYKPVEVLQAYQAKALLMDKNYNFITDLNPNAEIDALATDSMDKNLPLRGLPISVKDVFYVKDCDCTYGMPSFCCQPSAQDSSVVQSLRMLGAIPFVVTNMCQTGYSIESSNPIFGETVNPHNKNRTAGGSSGGEGAILASGGSLLGIGSDIGGSIRIPASYCGIFGLKPTSARISNRNTIMLFADQNLVNVSIGPLARRFDDLLALFKAMVSIDFCRIDPFCPPLGFDDKNYLTTRPLRIGYYYHLGESQVTCVPSVVRAIKMAKKALEAAGHSLVEFSIPNIDKAMFELYFPCLFTDGGYGFVNKLLKNNPVDPSLSMCVNLLRFPNILKKLISYALYPFNKNYSYALHGMAGVPSVYHIWDLKCKLDSYKEDVIKKWQSAELDGIICPVLPVTAVPCKTSQYIMDIASYTMIYNLLDFPAGSVPVTTVNQHDINELLRSYPRNSPTHRQIIELQRDSLAMPVGVQCVSAPWREEICLRIMGDIDRHL